MSEKNSNSNIPLHKLRVYVYKKLPHQCPFCSGQLVPAKLKTKKGKLINLDMASCKRCNKRFATHVFCTNYENNIVLENPEEALPLIEERKAKLEARKKRREEQEAKEIRKKNSKGNAELVITQPSKTSILEMIIQEWNSIPDFDVNSFGNVWKQINFRPSVFGSLFVIFLVQNKNGEFRCYAISSVYKDVEVVGSNTTILHVNSKISQAFIDSVKAKQTCFDCLNNHFNVVGAIAIKEADLAKRVDRVNLKKLYSDKKERISEVVTEHSFNYSSRECVYVYFRLTNTCVRYNHEIETVTTKTINAKNGEQIEVNVFHCLKCDKYFINHEALQEYISRGIFPAFNYSMVRDANSTLKEASQLMLYGYSVREGALSGNERHSVLSWIIDSGLMTKAEIIKDLEFKVRYNGSRAGYEKARMKWQDDIQFVSRYVIDNKREIQAEYLSRE